MTGRLTAVSVLVALLATGGPAAADTGREVVPDGHVEATIHAPACGPGGRTLVQMDFSTVGRDATVTVERRHGLRTWSVQTEGLTRRLEFRVRSGRPISLRLHDGDEVVASAQLSGYPC